MGQDSELRIKVNISLEVRPVQAHATVFGYKRNDVVFLFFSTLKAGNYCLPSGLMNHYNVLIWQGPVLLTHCRTI